MPHALDLRAVFHSGNLRSPRQTPIRYLRRTAIVVPNSIGTAGFVDSKVFPEFSSDNTRRSGDERRSRTLTTNSSSWFARNRYQKDQSVLLGHLSASAAGTKRIPVRKGGNVIRTVHLISEAREREDSTVAGRVLRNAGQVFTSRNSRGIFLSD